VQQGGLDFLYGDTVVQRAFDMQLGRENDIVDSLIRVREPRPPRAEAAVCR